MKKSSYIKMRKISLKNPQRHFNFRQGSISTLYNSPLPSDTDIPLITGEDHQTNFEPENIVEENIPAWWEHPDYEYPFAPSALQKFVLERSLNNAYCLTPCTTGNTTNEAYFWFYCLRHHHIYAVEFSKFMEESPRTNGCPICITSYDS